MSILTDMALEASHFPEPAPTIREAALVQAFRWGHIGLPTLYEKLGLRALHVCSHFGIYSSTPADPSALAGPAGNADSGSAGVDLSEVETGALLAELDRRSAG